MSDAISHNHMVATLAELIVKTMPSVKNRTILDIAEWHESDCLAREKVAVLAALERVEKAGNEFSKFKDYDDLMRDEVALIRQELQPIPTVPRRDKGDNL